MFLLGDSDLLLKDILSETIDLICCDPPYGIKFMGKDWDKALVSVNIWKECYRVLKQGKLAFIMCSPRQDVLSRMIVNLQDAGFRTDYTSIYWTYASGFPKAKKNKDGNYVGFQPKPAVEVILVISKGKVLTWLDDCRIPYRDDKDKEKTIFRTNSGYNANSGIYHNDKKYTLTNVTRTEKGRFPANLLIEDNILNNNRDYSKYFDLNAWASIQTLPFIISPKASNHERKQNHHPTIKPIKLMSYLIVMGSREGDLVLDPFCGSGTTCIASQNLNRKWIGMEINQEYIDIARSRITRI